MSKVSFVMPVKNRENLVGETIQTIIGQSLTDWELIIVDDHSTDKTAEVIESFKDERIKLYFLPERLKGAASARNFGNCLASSGLILVTDSDDLYYKERAEITRQYFQDNPRTNLFYAHAEVWEMEKNIRRERRIPFTPFDIEKFKEVDFIPHSTVAYRKKDILEIPYNPLFTFAEDYDVVSRFVVFGKKIGYLDKKIMTQRVHAGRMSQNRLLQEEYADLVKVLRGWKVNVHSDKEIIKILEV